MTTEERRRALLDAASRLFRHYGHAKTTIADIAREAGVGVGTVYLEFSSKESIVEALSSSAHFKVLDAMYRAARKRSPAELEARLSAVLEARTTCFLELMAEGQHACELVHCKASAVRDVHARFRDEERALLAQILDEAAGAQALGDLDVRRAAALVQRAFASLSPPWLFEQPRDEALRSAAEMAQLLLRGLLPRAAGRRR